MSELPPVDTLLGWVRDGQDRLERAVAELPEHAVAAPSALDGWTRGHVLTHVSRNADALVNLLTWARTGVRTPMYASPEQRNADIEAGAPRGLDEQRADLRDSAGRFAHAAETMPDGAWAATVASAQGREIPASEVPWMRVREVWIHLVDLAAGVDMDALPPELAWTLVRDVTGWMSARVDGGVQLAAEGHGTLTLGSGTPRGTLSGPPARLAAWLTGRAGTDGLDRSGEIPALPRWL